MIIRTATHARLVNDDAVALTHERISIGTIKSGEQIKRTTSALLYGQEGAQQKLVAHLEYNLSGSNAVFEKSAETSLHHRFGAGVAHG